LKEGVNEERSRGNICGRIRKRVRGGIQYENRKPARTFGGGKKKQKKKVVTLRMFNPDTEKPSVGGENQRLIKRGGENLGARGGG